MKGSLPHGEDLAGRVPVVRRRGERGLTLIELLVVVAVIAVLAGLTLAAMGGVNQKAARDRTKAEIAAISSALEAYRSQHGEYPAPGGGAVGELVPYADIRGYFVSERITVTNDVVIDPFGTPYNYALPGVRNRVGFDLWSHAGAGTNEPHKFIGNW